LDSLTREQVRSIDACAIETLGVPGVVLMENAGRNCADRIETFLVGEGSRRVAIVAGKGNNGGDGHVIARHLRNRGAGVEVFLLADDSEITGDAATNLAIIRNLGVTVHSPQQCSADALGEAIGQGGFDLIVDAIGGTGISGALRGSLAEAVEQVNGVASRESIPVVAVDIPTGLDCDTGQADGPAIRAALTVTFVARKVGFDQPGSREYTGEVVVVDIGIDPADVLDKQGG
jgi:NAD(P)H-hydrate epimerase